MKECCSNSAPGVSVITPVFNAGERLELCIDSVLGQDFPDFELILVDDGSTDGSGEVCVPSVILTETETVSPDLKLGTSFLS